MDISVKQEHESLIEVSREVENDSGQSLSREPNTERRRFLLVSRKIVAVHGPPQASHLPNISLRPRFVTYVKAPTHYLEGSHRVCLICQIIRPISELRLVSYEYDKLFLILLGISRKNIEVSSSNNSFKQSPFFSCRAHFQEASSEILYMFGVSCASGIHKARHQKVSEVQMFARHVTRNSVLNYKTLFSSAFAFVLKYPKEATPDSPIVKEEDIPYEKTIECKSDAKDDVIVPKCFRQPRKQRFEKEENDCISSMLRIIRREPLHLPTDHAPYPSVVLQKPFKCCYCLEIHEKEMMLHVPKTKGRITLWAQNLGEEFGERLRMNPANYMCRKHFSSFDLSPRGRLRRNAMPNFVPQPEIHTFKIYGDQFVKVEDNHLKILAGENSDIDIEN